MSNQTQALNSPPESVLTVSRCSFGEHWFTDNFSVDVVTSLCVCFHHSELRSKRRNRGQGGVIAQLTAVSDQIRPDLLQSTKQTKRKTAKIPSDVPLNVMAPRPKQVRRVSVLSSFVIVPILYLKPQGDRDSTDTE